MIEIVKRMPVTQPKSNLGIQNNNHKNKQAVSQERDPLLLNKDRMKDKAKHIQQRPWSMQVVVIAKSM